MPSQFDTDAANRWAKPSRFQQTVIRRIGGQANRAEEVEANVDFDERLPAKIAVNVGGMIDGDKGQHIDIVGVMDIAASQDNTPEDTWVIDGVVYRQHGEPQGSDGGCKSVVIFRRIDKRARSVRTSR